MKIFDAIRKFGSDSQPSQKRDLPTGQLAYQNPARYAETVVRHFGGDMQAVHAHMQTLSGPEAHAILNHSADYRKFLGVYPTGVKRLTAFVSAKMSQSKPDSIAQNDAPVALASAAVMFDSTTKQYRALKKLETSLSRAALKETGPEALQYRESVETALVGLIGNIGELKSRSSLLKATEIVQEYTRYLEPRAQAKIRETVEKAQRNPKNAPHVHEFIARMIAGLSSDRASYSNHVANRPGEQRGRDSVWRRFQSTGNDGNIGNQRSETPPPLPPRRTARRSLDHSNIESSPTRDSFQNRPQSESGFSTNSDDTTNSSRISEYERLSSASSRRESLGTIPLLNTDTQQIDTNEVKPNPGVEENRRPRSNSLIGLAAWSETLSEQENRAALSGSEARKSRQIRSNSVSLPSNQRPFNVTPSMRPLSALDLRRNSVDVMGLPWVREREHERSNPRQSKRLPPPNLTQFDPPEVRVNPGVDQNRRSRSNSLIGLASWSSALSKLEDESAPIGLASWSSMLSEMEDRATESGSEHKTPKFVVEKKDSGFEEASDFQKSNNARAEWRTNETLGAEPEEVTHSETPVGTMDRALPGAATENHRNRNIAPPKPGPFAQRDPRQVFSELTRKLADQPDGGRKYFEGLRVDIVNYLNAQVNPAFAPQWINYLNTKYARSLGAIDGSSTENLRQMLAFAHNHVQSNKSPQELIDDLNNEGFNNKQFRTMLNDVVDCAGMVRSDLHEKRKIEALQKLNANYANLIGYSDASSVDRLEQLEQALRAELKERYENPTRRMSAEDIANKQAGFDIPPQDQVYIFRNRGWTDDHLALLKKKIDACRVPYGRDISAGEFNDAFKNLLPMEEKTLEGYKALSDAIALDLALRTSPEQRLNALKTGGWNDNDLEELIRAIQACSDPQGSAQAMNAFNANPQFDELPRMSLQSLESYNALLYEVRRDLIFRNTPKVLETLKQIGWKSDDIFHLKQAIDGCNDPQFSAAATQYFNGTFIGALLPPMSDATREDYMRLSTAIALDAESGTPMYAMRNAEIIAGLKDDEFFRNNPDAWTTMATTLENSIVELNETPAATATYNTYYKGILGADVEALRNDLRTVDALEARTEPPLSEWEKNYCAVVRERLEKISLLAGEFKAYALELAQQLAGEKPRVRKVWFSDRALWVMPQYRGTHVDFSNPTYGGVGSFNADAVIAELVRGGFGKEQLNQLKLDIQRMSNGSGTNALKEEDFDNRYANVFTFESGNERSRLAKLSMALGKYVRNLP